MIVYCDTTPSRKPGTKTIESENRIFSYPEPVFLYQRFFRYKIDRWQMDEGSGQEIGDFKKPTTATATATATATSPNKRFN